MAKQSKAGPGPERAVIGFRPMTLVSFSIGLVLAGGLLGSGMVGSRSRGDRKAAPAPRRGDDSALPAPAEVPPWGELITKEIWVERPEEYVAFEVRTNRAVEWDFDGKSPEAVRNEMLAAGMGPGEVARALAANRVSVTPERTVVQPDDELVLSLSPKTRAALYGGQLANSANPYITTPFILQSGCADDWLAGSELDREALGCFKKLVYQRGKVLCFSDLDVMMRALPSDKERLALVKAVSRQPALLARLHVRPDTDVDKLLGYWGRGARAKDARPLLESLKRSPDGGSISLLYLLPPFARDRLFTFPRPPGPNQTPIDCHWSTMNFFMETPNERFSDPIYTAQYLQTNYYPIAKPTLYGDLVLVVKGGTKLVHSAVYLAEDIVFTKNGNNFHQPWTLMRMKDLAAIYDKGDSPQLEFQRQNNR